jgi:hypothetical protein
MVKTTLPLIALALMVACVRDAGTSPTAATGTAAASSGTHLQPAETIHVDEPQDVEVAFDAIWSTNEFIDAVTRIDGATFEPRTIPLGAGFAPQEIEPFDGSMWVAGVGGLLRLDPSNGEAIARINGRYKGLAAGSGELLAGGPGRLARIDPATNTITATIDGPTKQLCDGAVGTGAIWMSCGSTVLRIDPDTNRVVATIHREGRVLEAGGLLWLVSGRDIFQVEDERDAFTTLRRLDPARNRVVPETRIDLVHGASSPFPEAIGDTIWFPVSAGVGPDVGKLIEFDARRGRIVQTFDLSEGHGYGYNSIGFGYGSAWTASAPFNMISRWLLPRS